MKKLTLQEKVITYLERKEKWLQERTTWLNIPFVTEADKAEVRSWLDEDCTWVFTMLGHSYNGLGRFGCPWCILFNCQTCNYGKRHGECNYSNSTYRVFLEALDCLYPTPDDVSKWLEGLR